MTKANLIERVEQGATNAEAAGTSGANHLNSQPLVSDRNYQSLLEENSHLAGSPLKIQKWITQLCTHQGSRNTIYGRHLTAAMLSAGVYL